MTTQACEHCRAILHHLLAGAGMVPLGSSGLPESPVGPRAPGAAVAADAQALVPLRRAYEVKLSTWREGTIEHEGTRGIIEGIQLSINTLRGRGVEIDDPAPPKTRAKRSSSPSSSLLTSTSIVRNETKKTKATPTEVTPATHPALDKMQTAILLVAAGRYPEPTSDEMLSILTVYKRSGSFTAALGELRAQGLIEGDGSSNVVTSEGMGRVVVPVPGDRRVVRGSALAQRWIAKLERMEAKLLEASLALAKSMNSPISDDALAREADYRRSGSFTHALGRLRAIGLIGRKTNLPIAELTDDD